MSDAIHYVDNSDPSNRSYRRADLLGRFVDTITNEQNLIALYVALTKASENLARSVLIHLDLRLDRREPR